MCLSMLIRGAFQHFKQTFKFVFMKSKQEQEYTFLGIIPTVSEDSLWQMVSKMEMFIELA